VLSYYFFFQILSTCKLSQELRVFNRWLMTSHLFPWKFKFGWSTSRWLSDSTRAESLAKTLGYLLLSSKWAVACTSASLLPAWRGGEGSSSKDPRGSSTFGAPFLYYHATGLRNIIKHYAKKHILKAYRYTKRYVYNLEQVLDHVTTLCCYSWMKSIEGQYLTLYWVLLDCPLIFFFLSWVTLIDEFWSCIEEFCILSKKNIWRVLKKFEQAG
jgi:hypothetical protein